MYPLDGIMKRDESSRLFSNPMNTHLGWLECPAAERSVGSNPNTAVTWKPMTNDRIQTKIGYLHLFTDTSHISLEESSGIFNPLRVTLLNLR